MATIAENLLYECLREMRHNKFYLSVSADGEVLIERGIMALQIHSLAEDTLDAQKLAEWNHISKRMK
jgi:hypothetical protein